MKPTHRLIIATVIALVSVPGSAAAQTVLGWQSDVSVAQSGMVTVQETIRYDPQDNTHHGIIRIVPAQLREPGGGQYYSILELKSVTNEQGQAYPIAEKTVNRTELAVKVGDADTTLTPGPHVYVITYTITPLVTHNATTDRLNINLIGDGWQTPVAAAQATIRLPGNTPATQLACYTGRAGSPERACTISQAAPGTVNVTLTRPLLPQEALTADISFAPAGLGQYLEPGRRPPLSQTEMTVLTLLLIAGVGLMVGTVIMVGHAIKQWRTRRSQTIIPIYEPPAQLTPAHLSILESPAADVADITATLIHLAVRGVVKLEQTRAKTWYRQADYRLSYINPTAQLAPFEAGLVTAIFEGADHVQLRSLRTGHTKLPAAIQKFREQLGADLTAHGYFVSSPTGWISAMRLVMGLITIFLIGFAGGILATGDTGGWFIAVLAAAAAALYVWLAFKPTGRTDAGTAEWANIKGFKWFMEVTEKDRLKFFDAPERTPELFSKMLPYAIALKVEKQWAKQFEGIDVSQAVAGWYVGSSIGNFSATSFTSSFSSSFGGAMSSNFAGSSGGGSAGGGGGGGGGGGW